MAINTQVLRYFQKSISERFVDSKFLKILLSEISHYVYDNIVL